MTSTARRACATSRVHAVHPDQLNAYDVLNSDDIVFTAEAFEAFVASSLTRRRQIMTIHQATWNKDPRDVVFKPHREREELHPD